MGLLIRLVVNAFAIWVVTLIDPLEIEVIPFGDGSLVPYLLTLLVIAVIFAVVNTVIGTIIKVLAFPLYILTLGLMSLLINGFLLWLTGWFTSWWAWGLRVESFWLGVVAAVVIGLINWLFGALLRPQRKR